MRRIVGPFVVLVLALATIVGGVPAQADPAGSPPAPASAAAAAAARSATPAATPAAPVLTSRPNIVYIVTDDQTYESLDVAMPYLTSEPGGSWVRFDNAVVSVSNCCPSRSSVLTGQFAHHHGVTDNTLGFSLDDSNVLPVWLSDAGYDTALVGKYLNHYPFEKPASYVPPGWDRWFAYNPRESEALGEDGSFVVNDQGVSRTYPANPRNHSTDLFTTQVGDYLRTAPEPFFLWSAPQVPHSPFEVAARYVGTYADTPVPRTPAFNEADVSDKPAWVRALPALKPFQEKRMDTDRRKAWESVRAVDDQVREVVKVLRARGLMQRTVIVVTSDNSLSFGEHRWKEVKNCAYEECIHVPLMVRYPGTTATGSEHVTTNIDLGTTFAALAGATPGRVQDGRSMVPLMSGAPTTWTDEALLQKPRASGLGGGNDDGGPGPQTSAGYAVTPYWGLRTDRWTYVEYERTGERELYDLQADPHQLENIHGRPGTEAVTQQLAARLAVLKQ